MKLLTKTIPARNNRTRLILGMFAITTLFSANAFSEVGKEMLSPTVNTFSNPPSKNTRKLYEQVILPDGSYKVTLDNFVRAETNNYHKIKVDNGCFGRFCHQPKPADVNNQTVIRTNRDTRYSAGIFDLNSPLTITFPDSKGRFMSMEVINEDSFLRVFYEPGNYTFTKENTGTRFLHVFFRTLVDPNDAQDNKIVDALQEEIIVTQADKGKFDIPNWDQNSLSKTRNLILGLAKDIPNSRGCFGTQSETDPIRQLVGVAAGYAGNPEEDAFYFNLNPPKNDGKTAYSVTLKDVPVDAFWSISLYNEKGYYEPNKYNSYNVNSVTAKKNEDGSATINFGGDPSQPNFLYIMPGWNYMMRLYRPHQSVLDGTWKFPELVEVK